MKKPLDDRGQPIELRRGEIISTLSGRLRGQRPVWWGVASLVPIGLLIFFYGYRLSVVGFFTTAGYATATILFVYGLIFAAMQYRLRYKKNLPELSATSTAFGHCGACGYDLTTGTPAEDGCVVCPECGAAWHKHRQTHADIGLDVQGKMLKLAVAGSSRKSQSAYGTKDDRGVVLLGGYSWPHSMFAGRMPESAAPAVALFKRRRWTIRYWCYGVAFAVWLVLMLLFVLGGAFRQPSDLIAMGAGLGGFLGFVALMASFINLSAARVRQLSLRACRCPECFTPLEPQLVAFDGCTVCRGCRAAWNVVDVGPEPLGY